MNKVKVALIGYGHLGKWHAQKAEALNFSELVGIADLSDEQLSMAKENHPDVILTKDFKELYSKVDAFVIVTTTSSHHFLLKEVVQAGKHVFCEKPLCQTYEQAKEILGMKQDKVYMTGHSERCHEVWQSKMFNLDGALDVHFKRVTPFKGRAADVDVLQDLTIHDIDLATYLLNEDIESIVVEKMEKSVTEYTDTLEAVATMQSGRKVRFTTDRNHDHEERSVHIRGAHDIYIDLMNTKIRVDGEESDYNKRDHLLIEHESFYKAILTGSDPLTSFEEGAQALKNLEMIYKASQK